MCDELVRRPGLCLAAGLQGLNRRPPRGCRVRERQVLPQCRPHRAATSPARGSRACSEGSRMVVGWATEKRGTKKVIRVNLDKTSWDVVGMALQQLSVSIMAGIGMIGMLEPAAATGLQNLTMTASFARSWIF